MQGFSSRLQAASDELWTCVSQPVSVGAPSHGVLEVAVMPLTLFRQTFCSQGQAGARQRQGGCLGAGERALHSGCSGSISACSPRLCYPGVGQSPPNRAEIPLWATGLQLRGPDRAAVTLLAVLWCWVQRPAPHCSRGAEAAGRLRAWGMEGLLQPCALPWLSQTLLGECCGVLWVCLSPACPEPFLEGSF